MLLSDHDLRQINEPYLKSLGSEQLLGVSIRLLNDLKEARERLNQNPTNSSRPPSSREPWVVAKMKEPDEELEEESLEEESLSGEGVFADMAVDEKRDGDSEKENKSQKKDSEIGRAHV